MQSKLLLFFLFYGVFPASLFAQKTEKICGEYTYRAPENVSLEQAKQIALERAKLEALSEKFGTTVSQNNATMVRNENEKSDVRFLSLSASEVKGEWLEDVKVEYENPYVEQGMLIVKVSVCGKARKITGAGIDFSAKILRNGTEAKYESDHFKEGDDLFLLFQSPVDGYLAVYLVDETPTAFRMLPYAGDASGRVPVKGGKEYLFFSSKHVAHSEAHSVAEYTMTCDKQTERNFIYTVFSPNEFTKANDILSEGETVLLPELPFDEFQKWLVKNRTKDKDMKVEIKSITIKR
jgi:hypothetical protein